MPFRARIDGKQGDCFRILDNGKMPLQVENLDATVTIANPRLSKATLLDINGMATATPVEFKQVGGKATVVCRPTRFTWCCNTCLVQPYCWSPGSSPVAATWDRTLRTTPR